MLEQSLEFGEMTYDSGGHYGPVSEEYLNLAYIFQGSARVVADGKRHRFSAGSVVLMHTRTSMEIIYPENEITSTIWCHTRKISSSSTIRPLIELAPVQLSPTNALLDIFRLGVLFTNNVKEPNVKRVQDALGLAAFYEYFHIAKLEAEADKLPSSIKRAKAYLEDNYQKDITLQELSDVAALSPNYLVKKFHMHLNVTPIKYLWRIRTEMGASLLQRSGLSIANIAFHCGFKNPHHFSRHIKVQYGKTPTQLRNENWANLG